MNAPLNRRPPSSNGNKTIWAAVAVLVVVVLAMGAALIRIQHQPVEPRMAVLPAQPQKTIASEAEKFKQNQAIAPINKASVATNNVATTEAPSSQNSNPVSATPQVVHPQTPEPAVARPPPAPQSIKPQ